MKWSELNLNPSQKELWQFSALLAAFGLVFLCWNYLAQGNAVVRYASVIAIALGGVGLVKPLALRWLFVGWMIAAYPFGRTVSKVLLGFAFLCVFLPIGLAFRLMGRDALRLKRPGPGSLWYPYEANKSADRYLKQF